MNSNTINEKEIPNNNQKITSSTETTEEVLYKEDALELSSLSLKERFEYKKRQQKQILSSMDKKQKITYIIQYYKWHFVIALFAFIGLIQLGITIYQKSLPTMLSVAFINNIGYSAVDEYVSETYRDYYDLNKQNHIEVYTNLYKFAQEDAANFSNISPIQQELSYYNMYESIDVIICDAIALKAYVSADETLILKDALDDTLYQQIEEHIVTLSDPTGIINNGEPYSIAIDISDTDFAKNCKLTHEDVYLLIPSTEYASTEKAASLIKLIFGL